MGILYYGDNLTILREQVKDESVDLVYLDPPFNSNASYNVLFKAPDGHESHAQMEAFEDTWHWNETAEKAFDEVMQSGNSDAAEMLRAMRSFLHDNDMMAYLAMMAVRLLELHRVLKPTGSLYLHCDPTASHYLKILLDAIFGKENYRSEIVWKRTSAHSAAKHWNDVHDTIFLYTISAQFTWNTILLPHDAEYTARYRNTDEQGRIWSDDNLTGPGIRHGESGAPWRGFNPTEKGLHWKVSNKAVATIVGEAFASNMKTLEKLDALDKAGLIHWPKTRSGKDASFPRFKRVLGAGAPVQDVVTDIPPLNSQAQERLGYPTQKPLALLERIINASSNEGDVVLDPFCGCGTTVHAAQKLKREWIGIDITHLAISLIQKRLRDAFGPIPIEIHGTPKDLEGAQALAAQDKYQFQWWAVSLVDAIPYGGKKKGADSGIDGLIYFKTDKTTTEKAIVSVKGGENVGVGMIRDLIAVVDREKAKMGLLLTLAPPTGPMIKEAASAGIYKTESQGNFPKVQILTIEQLFAGQKPDMPWIDSTVFKKAKREMKGTQEKLL
jgi:site-specific DNA-methyltransferase (adenine-specific)